MRNEMIAAGCVLSLATCALAANPTLRLHPDDADALKAARIQVSCRILNAQVSPDNPHYAFEISAAVPEGFTSLDAVPVTCGAAPDRRKAAEARRGAKSRNGNADERRLKRIHAGQKGGLTRRRAVCRRGASQTRPALCSLRLGDFA